ncbi:hypothetical protein CYLTODRAFT_417826 [Cylindrobasidium torrendii FP15055 ss-10]|uniref:Uncharacterized protein n=1 Tax=Cylindrobasidium torrendii FP15055 ss-10 TaxID=1314674 RepID=A0A0D7BR26_9AGAR|nr:hypothetical protein CYLTODRAFT_417826 [Cylindrobasidium torrendii FP15055 ss-10]
MDCFSLSRSFGSPVVEIPYICASRLNTVTLDQFEFYHGMDRGESSHILGTLQNTIKCRQDLAELLSTEGTSARMALLPASQHRGIEKLHNVITRNRECAYSERTVPEQDYPGLSHSYMLLCFIESRPTVYVRDPSTGQVVGYGAPYTDMPFITSTLDPCVWAARTAHGLTTANAIRFNYLFAMDALAVGLAYRTRVPVEFLYHGGRALADFPERPMPYTPQELGVPKLTTRKRKRVDAESDAGTLYSRNNRHCDHLGIKKWCDDATDTRSTGSSSATLVAVEASPKSKMEQAKASADAELDDDQWLHVLKYRLDEAEDKTSRAYYRKLIRDVDRAHTRSSLPAKETTIPTRSKIRRLR